MYRKARCFLTGNSMGRAFLRASDTSLSVVVEREPGITEVPMQCEPRISLKCHVEANVLQFYDTSVEYALFCVLPAPCDNSLQAHQTSGRTSLTKAETRACALRPQFGVLMASS